MIIMRKRYTLLILCVAWAILIFILCTMPSGGLPNVRIPHFDKFAHFGIFFVQSVLLSLLFKFQTRSSYFQIILLSTLLAFAYGGFLEIIQSNFFNRNGDMYDLIADMLGGFFGAIAYPTILRLFNKIY
jgi:Predicted integral membrane protein